MAETLRERITPWLPYWPWVVVPGLIVAILAVSAQNAAQARKLELVKEDVVALEHQVAVLKKTRAPAVAGATPFLLPPASAARTPGGHATAAGAPAARRTPADHAPRGNGGPGKAGKRGKRALGDE